MVDGGVRTAATHAMLTNLGYASSVDGVWRKPGMEARILSAPAQQASVRGYAHSEQAGFQIEFMVVHEKSK